MEPANSRTAVGPDSQPCCQHQQRAQAGASQPSAGTPARSPAQLHHRRHRTHPGRTLHRFLRRCRRRFDSASKQEGPGAGQVRSPQRFQMSRGHGRRHSWGSVRSWQRSQLACRPRSHRPQSRSAAPPAGGSSAPPAGGVSQVFEQGPSQAAQPPAASRQGVPQEGGHDQLQAPEEARLQVAALPLPDPRGVRHDRSRRPPCDASRLAKRAARHARKAAWAFCRCVEAALDHYQEPAEHRCNPQ
mmetsp:Transcript_56241/g.121182  ORF Transcript_56241/g.121182 Transcript_56241/m.121182 type:complete len:244 (+) Transcript_56241:2445-3176(+)